MIHLLTVLLFSGIVGCADSQASLRNRDTVCTKRFLPLGGDAYSSCGLAEECKRNNKMLDRSNCFKYKELAVGYCMEAGATEEDCRLEFDNY